MHGMGTYIDARLKDPQQFPVAARSESWNTRVKPRPDHAEACRPALLSAHDPGAIAPYGSYDKAAARGDALFTGKARCASCHVPPLFTEPGHNLHAPADIGVPDTRLPDRATQGLWTHQKGGFYHNGRFATLRDVLGTMTQFFKLGLTEAEKTELAEYLKSL